MTIAYQGTRLDQQSARLNWLQKQIPEKKLVKIELAALGLVDVVS